MTERDPFAEIAEFYDLDFEGFHDDASFYQRLVELHGERVLELRPSRRFDSTEGLARLAVLPADTSGTRSRGGWTVQLPAPRRRRLDRSTAILAATYGTAVLLAIAIVLV